MVTAADLLQPLEIVSFFLEMIVLLLYLSRCRDSLMFRSSWLHRLCISLLTSCDAKILLLTTAALHFCSPAVELFFFIIIIQYTVDSCTLGKNKTGPELYDKFLWPVMAVSLKKRFSFPHDTQLVCGVLLVWRISPYWEFLPVFIRWCVSTSIFFFFPQHATHNLAFLVHFAVLSVGGVREKRGGEGESVNTGS